MNRKIKFRYWNDVTKQMVNDPPMPHKDGWTIEQLFSDRGWVWMQFTGLLDRNGKEIYEGDVVKILQGEWVSQHLGNEEEKKMTHEQYLDSLTKQYEVVYAADRFMGKRHIGYNPCETDQEGFSYIRLTPDKHGYVEIIGNIYENPELLTNN